jgi:hypothetical protein
MYTNQNFKTKKAFKEAIKEGTKITLYSPGLGAPNPNGWNAVEGPWYPQPHTWYAEALTQNGHVVKVK